ncbi:MAG: kinase/pyrophosphorylase, partial [Rhodospirillales bacterium]|nr:kinase/pyrophosphorylase [Rhodospirillales bacterium]
MTVLNLHLVSDSTGETVGTVAHACMVQFPDVDAEEFVWPMVRTKGQIAEVIAEVRENPGFVLYTLVNPEISRILEDGCRELQIPCMGILDPIVAALGGYIGTKARARPGLQHVLDAQYFGRIDAIQFALAHDDGQSLKDLGGADVLILGVSRTSK